MKTIHYILILIAFAIGFFLGRVTIETKEIVRYVKGETVYGRVAPDFLTVKHEFKTGVNFLPYYFWIFTVTDTDTTYIEPDTAKIVEDFLIRREYEFTVFDNENGKFIASPTVQYNRLQSFDYSFTPIQKEITRYMEKVFTPFVGMSYNTLNYIGISGGIFYHNLGLEYQYSKNIISSSDVHEMGLKVKF